MQSGGSWHLLLRVRQVCLSEGAWGLCQQPRIATGGAAATVPRARAPRRHTYTRTPLSH